MGLLDERHSGAGLWTNVTLGGGLMDERHSLDLLYRFLNSDGEMDGQTNEV